MNFQMFMLDLGKAEEPEIKLPTSAGSSKKQESSRKTFTSALSTMPKPLCGSHKLWKILKEMGIPHHLICLLRNLYTCQEATVRTGHGTLDWFQIGKGIGQGCILLPLLYCYLTYMQSISCEMLDWMKHKLESRLLGETSTTSDMQMTPLWQKVKKG